MKLSDLIYFAQTDTTAGFLSQNRFELMKRKKRKKGFLICVDSFSTLKEFVRVPKKFKKFARRNKKTTFVYPNKKAIRVITQKRHLLFLKKFGWMYSTSANLSGKKFDINFALKNADVIVRDKKGFFEDKVSRIIKLGKKRMLILRK